MLGGTQELYGIYSNERLIMIKFLITLVLGLAPVAAYAETHVIGDSIAVGIANANGLDRQGNNRWRKGGRDTRVILGYIDTFIATGYAKGATVILSSGASNSTFERPNGEGRKLDVEPIRRQIRKLKSAGATVFLVGTGSQHSPWLTNRYGTYRVNFASQNVNARLAEIARQEGVVFLGPLERYSPELNSIGDGIHPGPQGARQIYKSVKNY